MLFRLQLPSIDNSDYGCSIFSFKFKVIFPLIRSIILKYRTLRTIARRTIGNKSESVYGRRMIKCFADQIRNCESLRTYFLTERLADVIKNPTKQGFCGMYCLFTIISLIEVAYSQKHHRKIL